MFSISVKSARRRQADVATTPTRESGNTSPYSIFTPVSIFGSMSVKSEALLTHGGLRIPLRHNVTISSQRSARGFCGSWRRKVNKGETLTIHGGQYLEATARTDTAESVARVDRTGSEGTDRRGAAVGSAAAVAVGGEVNITLPVSSCLLRPHAPRMICAGPQLAPLAFSRFNSHVTITIYFFLLLHSSL